MSWYNVCQNCVRMNRFQHNEAKCSCKEELHTNASNIAQYLKRGNTYQISKCILLLRLHHSLFFHVTATPRYVHKVNQFLDPNAEFVRLTNRWRYSIFSKNVKNVHSAYCNIINSKIVVEMILSKALLPIEWATVTAVFSSAVNGNGWAVAFPSSDIWKESTLTADICH